VAGGNWLLLLFFFCCSCLPLATGGLPGRYMTSASPMGIYDYDRSRARQPPQPFAWGAEPPSSAAAPGVVLETDVKFVSRVS
jgi:hypothetical protein